MNCLSRIVFNAALLAGLLLVTPTAPAQQLGGDQIAAMRQAEESVRQMPMERRPNRIGHFYGNNVRRLQQRTLCVNCADTSRPLARFFYLPN